MATDHAPTSPRWSKPVSDEIDPEIAALIGGNVEEYRPGTAPRTGGQRPIPGAVPGNAGAAGQPGMPHPPANGGPLPPDFATLFGDLGVTAEVKSKGEFDVDLARKGFAPIEKMEEEKSRDFFADPDYYKKALGGEGDESQKFHEILSKYMKATDIKDKGIYRQQLISAYWYLVSKVALRTASSQVLLPKRLLVRYGALLPNVLSPELKDALGRILFEKSIDEPVYYVDEWIRAVATGQVNPSATDEVKPQRGAVDDKARYAAMIQKSQGKRDAAEGIMKAKVDERRSLEALLRDKMEIVLRHESQPGLLHVPSPYTEAQKKTMGEFFEVTRRMLAVDKELAQTIADFSKAGQELEVAMEKAGPAGAEATKADLQVLAQEYDTVKQMTKLCIGRQGNHFPLLSREYFHGNLRDIGSRENVVKLLAWIESIDCEAYCRPYKNTLHRIVPFILLVPCYGDTGICWEPFDRFNRASSRGRVAIPMYPKNLQIAVLTAVADLRWQVAKEKASFYWMEEGLTGNYYQWFTAKKIRGDVKEFFIQDYVTWITKESEGIQKLEKEVRAIFWRFMPYSKEVKDKLKTRSYVYQELYQKDVNRSLSDGY